MIYELAPHLTEPLRQGDIIFPLPLLTLDPNNLYIHQTNQDSQQLAEGNWLDVNLCSPNGSKLIVNSESVFGIVANQDCDAQRIETLTCFLVRKMSEKEITALGSTLKKQAANLIKQSRSDEKKFYLPSQSTLFDAKYLVDFQTVITINRKFVQDNISKMLHARLNEVARRHFRQKVGDYFWRYSYDEWYLLSKDEFTQYEHKNAANPFPHQE